jgi:DNA recombination protein RmuC
MSLLFFIAGTAAGAVVAWAIFRARGAALAATLEHERRANAEKLALVEDSRGGLENAFKALCADALKSNNESFLALARAQLEQLQQRATSDLEQRQKTMEQLVTPIRESLDKVDGKIQELERARAKVEGSLVEHLRALAESQRELRAETSNLVNALRSPTVRGQWGEMQLRRVVEAAGMVSYCDFAEQATIAADGRLSRPDLIVRLAGGKQVVVDAKAPLDAYLKSLEARDEDARVAFLVDHARQLREHVYSLSAKTYWSRLDTTPEFVVLFIPGETFFSAALEQDPSLIEEAAKRQVILATPTTLIAVLWAIAHGWREERIAENARAISALGRELHTRLGTLASHFAKLKRSIDGVVRSYNDAAGSLETRVLVSARRLKDLGATSTGEIEELSPVEQAARPLSAAELLPPPDEARLGLPEADAA